MTFAGSAAWLLTPAARTVSCLGTIVLRYGGSATTRFTCIALSSGLSRSRAQGSSVLCAGRAGRSEAVGEEGKVICVE